MKPKTTTELTQDEKRLLIAEACGWMPPVRTPKHSRTNFTSRASAISREPVEIRNG